jgi:hypothetical protein
MECWHRCRWNHQFDRALSARFLPQSTCRLISHYLPTLIALIYGPTCAPLLLDGNVPRHLDPVLRHRWIDCG